MKEATPVGPRVTETQSVSSHEAIAAEPAVPSSTIPHAIDKLLTQIDTPVRTSPPVLRAARVVALRGARVAAISWRGGEEPVDADVAPEVELDLLRQVISQKGLALVQTAGPSERPEVIGVVQTRIASPTELKLTADTVEIEGRNELLLRSGRAAVRLRPDGDIEIVGSRIYAASSGLFRIVGRLLRLN